jgi:hypothetical protein
VRRERVYELAVVPESAVAASAEATPKGLSNASPARTGIPIALVSPTVRQESFDQEDAM